MLDLYDTQWAISAVLVHKPLMSSFGKKIYIQTSTTVNSPSDKVYSPCISVILQPGLFSLAACADLVSGVWLFQSHNFWAVCPLEDVIWMCSIAPHHSLKHCKCTPNLWIYCKGSSDKFELLGKMWKRQKKRWFTVGCIMQGTARNRFPPPHVWPCN